MRNFSIEDILNEMIGKQEHIQLIECATAFINAQDSICKVHAYKLNEFTINFESDGYDYEVRGRIENGDVIFTAFYRKSDVFEENIEVDYLSPEGFKNALSTRNVYPLLVRKVIRLVGSYSNS